MIKEKTLYPYICSWLEKLLKDRFKKHRIIVEDTSRIKLSSWLQNHDLVKYITDGLCYDFKIDITGAVIFKNTVKLYLIECKANFITIKDLSQIFGYSRIARPYRSIIISPMGANSTLDKLITVYGRIDVLNYLDRQTKDSIIRICKWDVDRNTVDYNSTIPLGYHP